MSISDSAQSCKCPPRDVAATYLCQRHCEWWLLWWRL